MTTLARSALVLSTTVVAACLAGAPPAHVESTAPPEDATTPVPSSSTSSSARAQTPPAPPPAPDPRVTACVAYADRTCACEDTPCVEKEGASKAGLVERLRELGPSEQQWCNAALARAAGCAKDRWVALYERYARAACACTSAACWGEKTASFRADGGKDPAREEAGPDAVSALGRARACRASAAAGGPRTTPSSPSVLPPTNVCTKDDDCVLIDNACGCGVQHRLAPVVRLGPVACAKGPRCSTMTARCDVATGWCRADTP